MAIIRLAASLRRRERPMTQTRTGVVLELIPPEAGSVEGGPDNLAGWGVRLQFDGGEVARATVNGSYNPAPGDVVAVARYMNTLYVVGKVAAGDTGELPGGRVGYSYYDAAAAGVYQTLAAGTAEQALTAMTVACRLRTGVAYDVEVRQPFRSSEANASGYFRLRQDAAATGADLGELFRVATTTAGSSFLLHDTVQVRNDNSADLDVVLVVCAQPTATNAMNLFATPASKPWVEVRTKGASVLYPHAAPLPPPVEFT